jgi:hypothetical protein
MVRASKIRASTTYFSYKSSLAPVHCSKFLLRHDRCYTYLPQKIWPAENPALTNNLIKSALADTKDVSCIQLVACSACWHVDTDTTNRITPPLHNLYAWVCEKKKYEWNGSIQTAFNQIGTYQDFFMKLFNPY